MTSIQRHKSVVCPVGNDFNSFSMLVRGPSLYVYRRQILTYKDGPRTERVDFSGSGM